MSNKSKIKVLIITPLFDGMIPKIFLGNQSEPVGMPAVYKFQKYASKFFSKIYIINLYDINNRLISTDRNLIVKKKIVREDNIINIQLKSSFSGYMKTLDEKFPSSRLIGGFRMVRLFFVLNYFAFRFKPDFLYTATMLGFISGLISYFHKIPSLMRGYGTTLGTELNPGDLNSKKYFYKNFMEMYPYLMHQNILMANDGTHGINIAKSLNIPKEKFHFWINGIDKNIQKSELDFSALKKKFSIPDNKFILATVSRVDDWKRLDRIVNSMDIITKERKDIHLIISGDGQMFPTIKELISKLKLTEFITMTGSLKHTEALTLINGCDVFVSMYDLSNLGNPILEALLLGKCIISLEDGSLNDVIKNGYNGILISKVNAVQESSEIILDLMNNKEKVNVFSKNALITSETVISSWDERLKREIELISKIIENKQYAKLFNRYKRIG